MKTNEDIKKLVDPGTWSEDFNPENGITGVHFSVCGIPFRAQYGNDFPTLYAIGITRDSPASAINNLHDLITKLREATK